MNSTELTNRLAILSFWVLLGRPLTRRQASWAKRVLSLAGLASTGLAASIFALGTCGVPGEGPLRRMLSLGARPFHIGGSVAPGWEKVQEVFRRNFELGVEKSAQFCVYQRGVRVVDLFGVLSDQADNDDAYGREQYHENSLQLVMSCSKVLESLAVAIAVDKGFLDYGAPIVRYWSEFSNGDEHGKGLITLADLMRHQAGLTSFDEPVTKDDFLSGDFAGIIERTPAAFPKRTKRAYHGITRGLVVNEILKKVDPKRRTVGRYLQEMIAGPLGVAKNCHIGTLPEAEDLRVHPIKIVGLRQIIAQLACSYVAGNLGRGPPSIPLPASLGAAPSKRISDASKPRSFQSRMMGSAKNEGGKERSANESWNLRTESPSVNCVSNARTLARIAACLALGGELDGTRIISAKGLRMALSEAEPAYDAGGLALITHNTLGGFTDFSHPPWAAVARDVGCSHAIEGFLGWGGFGGAAMMFNPVAGMGVAYCVTQLGNPVWSITGQADPRCLRLMEAVRKCEAGHRLQSRL